MKSSIPFPLAHQSGGPRPLFGEGTPGRRRRALTFLAHLGTVPIIFGRVLRRNMAYWHAKFAVSTVIGHSSRRGSAVSRNGLSPTRNQESRSAQGQAAGQGQRRGNLGPRSV